MLTLPPSVRVFLCLEAVDMRRSFDGLSEAARTVVEKDPLSGHLFVFKGKRGDRVKVLFWDRSGFCLFYKRLEKGVFVFPVAVRGVRSAEVESADLMLLLEGIDLTHAKRRARWSPVTAATA